MTSHVRRSGNDYTDIYTLDLVGNRLEKNHDGLTDGVPDDEVISYSYNERDQLTDEDIDRDGTANDQAIDYEYDPNGSQTLKSTAAGDTVYKWDLHGRMVGIDTNDDGTADITYTYDSDGVRVSQSANGDTTYYLQDKQNPTGYAKAIEDRTDTGSNGSIDATTSYILGLQVIGQADASAVYYLLLDGHGSTVALTGTNGALVEEYAYSAFGEAIGFDANTAKTNWLFGGDGIWDAKSQMTYHLARWRDGHRFVSYDSFEADPRSPASLHKYGYVGSDPVGNIDPSGHDFFGSVGQLAVAGVKGILQAMFLPTLSIKVLAFRAVVGIAAFKYEQTVIEHYEGRMSQSLERLASILQPINGKWSNALHIAAANMAEQVRNAPVLTGAMSLYIPQFAGSHVNLVYGATMMYAAYQRHLELEGKLMDFVKEWSGLDVFIDVDMLSATAKFVSLELDPAQDIDHVGDAILDWRQGNMDGSKNSVKALLTHLAQQYDITVSGAYHGQNLDASFSASA